MKAKHPHKILTFCLILSGASSVFAQSTQAGWSSQLLQQLQKTPQWQQLEYQAQAADEDQKSYNQPLYNPELELSYEDKADRAYQVGISQQIDLYDKLSVRTQIGVNLRQIQELQQQQTVNTLYAGAITSLIEINQAQDLFELVGEQLKISERLVSLTQQRVSAGDANQIDLKLVQLSLTEALQTKAEAQSELQQRLAQRNNLLGATGITLPRQLSFNLSDEPDFTTLRKESLAARIAKLEALTSQISIHEATLNAKADPTLGLGFGEEGKDSVIALTLRVPLNIRNNYSAEIRAAEARTKVADQAMTQQIIQIENDLQRSWNTLQRQQLLLSQWQKPSDNNMAQLSKQLEKLWRLGELTTTTYLQNIQQLNTALAAEINLQAQISQSVVDWLKISNQLLQWLKQQ